MGYGKQQLVAPAVEPLDLDTVKDHLRIDDNDDDTVISTVWIPAARSLVEKFTDRLLITQTWRITLDGFPYGIRSAVNRRDRGPAGLAGAALNCGGSVMYDVGLRLPLSPVQSVSAIAYYDATNTKQTLDPSTYDFDPTTSPQRILPVFASFWPSTYPRTQAVQVDVVAGFGSSPTSIPAELIGAMLLQIELWFRASDIAPSSNLHDRVADILAVNWSGRLE